MALPFVFVCALGFAQTPPAETPTETPPTSTTSTEATSTTTEPPPAAPETTTSPPSPEPSPDPSTPPVLAEDLIAAARAELHGNPKKAVSLLEAAVASDPTRVDAWRLLGQAHSRLGDKDKARAAYTRALSLLPPDSGDAAQLQAVMQFLEAPPKAAGGFAPGAPSTALVPPEWRLFYRSTLALRYNPLGLFSDNRFALRRRLYESNSPIFNNNFASIALFPVISPAFTRFAVGAEIQPASFLTLWGNADLTAFFGTFNLMQSFPSARSNYSDSAIATLGDLAADNPAAPYPAVGGHITLGADLQFRVGPVVARNLFRAVRAEMQLRDGDRTFYDQQWDLLVPNAGWYINNDTDLLYATDFGLTAGIRFNVANAFYGDEHVAPGERVADLRNGPQARVGPLIAYTFYEDEGALFDRPTLLLVTNWWVAHRFRTGADVSQAIPMIALAFQVQGDFLQWNRPKNDPKE